MTHLLIRAISSTPLDGQALKWVRPKDLRRYPMPPADAPLIPHLEDLLG